MNSKQISFILIMGVLGNVLFAFSYFAGPIAPGVAFDFSLIAAYIAGFYMGPAVGFIAGLFTGVLPGIMYGPLGASAWLGLVGLPLGKAITGFTAGIISRLLRLDNDSYSSILMIPSTLISYIPEGLYTFAYFTYLMPLFLGNEAGFLFFLVLPKAIVEVAVMSILMAALRGNAGFYSFIKRFRKQSHPT